MKHSVRKALAALSLGFCVSATSCIGPDNAYNSVKTWNSKLTDSKFVNELAFLGLNIVPVYPLCLFGDYLIFNSWEFWTGNNLVGKPEPFKPQETAGS